MLDVVFGADRHRNALAGNLDFEALAGLQGVGKAAKLVDELVQWIVLLNVSARLGRHDDLLLSARLLGRQERALG